MADRTPFAGFIGSAYAPQSPNVDLQDLINFYLENSESRAAKTPQALLPCPGFTELVELPQSPVRGTFAQNDRFFVVAGDGLYEVYRDWTYVERAFTTLSDPVAPTITNSPPAAAILDPSPPVISQGGALGSTTYGYKITATNSHGETAASTETTTTSGNATLSSSNYNLVSWAEVEGATGYKVYRTTGPGSGVLVGVVASPSLFLLDTGTAGTVATPPSSNTTGGTVGSTTYGYKIVAELGLGHTAASGEGVTLTGQATLSEDDYNIVTWPAVTNAALYKVYRTTGGPSTPPVLIGTTTDTSFNDTGEDGESETPATSNNTATFSLEDDGQPVSMCSSGDAGNQILIGSGGGGYVFDLATATFAPVIEGCTAVGYIASYFVALDAATSTLKCSESLDGYTWNAAQIYQRTSAGDRWLGMGVTENEIWLFGSQTTDVYRATGNNDTRFAPFQGVNIDHGLIATASLVVDGGSFMFIGQNRNGAGTILRSTGYGIERISTRGIERQLASFSTLADAVGWIYEQEGHTFYVLNFPSDGVTWVYDTLTQEWHRRGYWDPNVMTFTAYRPQCFAFAFGGVGFGYHVVGDSESGVLALMSTDVATDIDGSLIRRVRQCPHVTNLLLNTTVWSLIIDLEVGLGLITGQGSDPTFMLQVSKNGGKTWGNERWKSAGPIGDYGTRVKFNRFGMGRDWVFRLVVTDPIPWRLAGAYFEPEAMAA